METVFSPLSFIVNGPLCLTKLQNTHLKKSLNVTITFTSVLLVEKNVGCHFSVSGDRLKFRLQRSIQNKYTFRLVWTVDSGPSFPCTTSPWVLTKGKSGGNDPRGTERLYGLNKRLDELSFNREEGRHTFYSFQWVTKVITLKTSAFRSAHHTTRRTSVRPSVHSILMNRKCFGLHAPVNGTPRHVRDGLIESF